MIDIHRLIFIEPFMVLIIGLGLIKLFDKKNWLTLGLISLLILAQLVFTISDLNLREVSRYHKYFDNNFLGEIGRQ
jgi:hypothetical protein